MSSPMPLVMSSIVIFFTGQYDNTWAFLMTPRIYSSLDDANSQEYAPQAQQLIAQLKKKIPNLGVLEDNYMQVPNVKATDTTKKYKYGYQGVALFEYDKNADGNGNADWRLWYEASSRKGRDLGQSPPGT